MLAGMKLGAALLALGALVALLGIAWLARRLVRRLRTRDTPAARQRIESRFTRAEKTKPLDPGHYYKRYWS